MQDYAVFTLSSLFSGISQQPPFRSKVINFFASHRVANMSSMAESGQLDFFGMLFSFLKSVQNLLMPSFLSTTTLGKLQGDLDRCIIAANISFTALSSTGCLAKGVLYGLNFIGRWLPVSIFMVFVLVFPVYVFFSAKRSTLVPLNLLLFNRYNYLLFQFIKKLTPRGVCCSHWLRSLTFKIYIPLTYIFQSPCYIICYFIR